MLPLTLGKGALLVGYTLIPHLVRKTSAQVLKFDTTNA